ncbi:MAG: hypothetical protein ACR2OZ_06290 [Verrucomicrobiales bacterium]
MAALLIGSPAAAQNGTDYLTGLGFDALTYNSGVLFWKADCVPTTAPGSLIQRVPSGGTTIHTYYQAATCDGLRVRAFAVNASRRVFWVTGDGRIATLPADAGPGTTPTILASLEAPNPTFVHIAVSRDYVYWAETFGEISDSGNIFRVPITGGVRGEVARLDGASGGGAVSLAAATVERNPGIAPTEVVYYRKAFGNLVKRHLAIVLPWVSTVLAPSVQAVDVAQGRLYFAESNAAGASAIRSVALNNTTAITDHAAISQAGNPEVLHIAADSQAVYWHEIRDGVGPFMRRLPGVGPSEAITVPMPRLGFETGIVSDGRHLYWGVGGGVTQTAIKRLPVNAAAITWNLQVATLEWIQAIQGVPNNVPMVAGKPTWIRLFGRIESTNSGQTSVRTNALLRGRRDGIDLPGSPLLAEMGEQVAYARDPNRLSQHEGWWFRLPQQWLAEGTIQLIPEVNPHAAPVETNAADNSLGAAFTFQKRDDILVWVHPLRTNNGTISEYHPDYQPTLDRAEAMLPAARLHVHFGGGPVIEEWQGTPFPWSFGPYELSKTDDDSSWIMIKLGIRKALLVGAEFLPDVSVHHCAFFHSFAGRAFNGLGTLSGKMLICFMDPGGETINRPQSGVTFAHELGHNFGRNHVGCGNPADPDANYPYPVCVLSAGTNPHVGFDPITRLLIQPATTSDLMSYGRPRWPSDYTWTAIFSELAGSSAAPLATERGALAPTGQKLLIAGLVASSGAAHLEPAVRLPDIAAQLNAAALLAEGTDKTSYQVRMLDADGNLLASAPASLFAASEGHIRPLFAVIDEDSAGVALELVRTDQPGTPVATRDGGGGAPTVAILTPAAGQVAGAMLAVRWTATDPEGQPLRHTVRYSHDAGTSWQVLGEDLRIGELDVPMAGLPGGPPNNALIEVLSSDGLRTGIARSPLFTVARRAPQAQIFFETERGRDCTVVEAVYRAGETIILRGAAQDAEDGPLGAGALAWSLIGPVNLTGTGPEFLPGSLPPGSYTVLLRATDSSGLFSAATGSFTVSPKNVADITVPPTLDGVLDDAAYLVDRRPIPLRYEPSDVASVRLVRDATFLYVAVAGLPLGSNSRQFVAISTDWDNSGSTLPQTGDRRFIAYADGEVASEQGNGSGFVRDPAPIFSARVSADAGRWNAEFQISLSLVGGSNAQTLGLDVGHYAISAAGDDVHWFNGDVASANRPDLWADVQMATDPELDRDEDRDTLADAWETTHLGGTHTDGSGDRDGDGQTDGTEFHAGTDPASAASRFALTSATSTPSGIELRWPSLTGHCYDVEASTDLVEFVTVAADLAGTGAELVFTVPPDSTAPSNRQLFTRLRARKTAP